jgi:hypothetical protein
VHTPTIPQDKVSRLQTWLNGPASPLFEPLDPRVLVLDMVVLRPAALGLIVLEGLPDIGKEVRRARHHCEPAIVRSVGQQIEQALNRGKLGLEGRLIGVRPRGGAVTDLGLGQRDR